MHITQGVRRAAQLRPDETAMICGDRKATWRELVAQVAHLAGALAKLGLEQGDRVAVLMLNSDRYLELYLGVAWAGAVIVPLNTRWSVLENREAVSDSGAKLLFVDAAYLEQGLSIASSSPDLVLVFADNCEGPEGCVTYQDILREAPVCVDVKSTGEDLAGIFYTGGTSGRSKGVMLSHNSLMASAFSALGEGLYPESSVFLHAAPMFHLANGSAMYSLFVSGGCHVIVPSFSPVAVFEAVQTYRISDLLLVPTMIQAMVDHPAIGSYDLSSAKRLVYGGSPISEAVLDRVHDKLPKLQLFQCYGMTELSPIACILRSEQHIGDGRARERHKSAGRPALGCDVRIVDANHHPVEEGVIGEVVVRGDTVMMGYWNRPEETAKALIGGWIQTGDAAYMRDGYVFLIDRFKDMIISGGENVYSIEVENALAQHPSVAQCAVIGIPSERWGEQVHAFVVPKDQTQVSAEELIDFCKARIANYKCPRSIDVRSIPLPLSGAGKVLKNELRKPFWDNKDRLVS